MNPRDRMVGGGTGVVIGTLVGLAAVKGVPRESNLLLWDKPYTSGALNERYSVSGMFPARGFGTVVGIYRGSTPNGRPSLWARVVCGTGAGWVESSQLVPL